MPTGASTKREREYEKLKREFKKEGRYQGREKEVAARIVNKQRRQFGETKKAKQQKRQGTSPDRELPIDDYRGLTVEEVLNRLDSLSTKELTESRRYEKDHKGRKTLLEQLDRAIDES